VSDVRRQLAEGLAAGVTPERVTALIDAALTAKKTEWVTVTCDGCGKTKKHAVEVGDPRTAAQVLQIVAEQGLGKASQEREITFDDGSKSKTLNRREDFDAMSMEELRMIANGEGELEIEWATKLSQFSDSEIVELESELPAERERRQALAVEESAHKSQVAKTSFRPHRERR